MWRTCIWVCLASTLATVPGCAYASLQVAAASHIPTGAAPDPDPDPVWPTVALGYAIDAIAAGAIVIRDEYSTPEKAGLVVLGLDALIATFVLIDALTD